MKSQQPQVSIVKRIAAPAKLLFDAWLDPQALAVFMCPAPGMSVSHAAADPRVGGAFLVLMKTGDKEMPHRGEYLEIAPYIRLAFSWHSEHAGEHSHVVLHFEALSDESTQLTLQHFDLPDDMLAAHDSGWTAILDCLARLVQC